MSVMIPSWNVTSASIAALPEPSTKCALRITVFLLSLIVRQISGGGYKLRHAPQMKRPDELLHRVFKGLASQSKVYE